MLSRRSILFASPAAFCCRGLLIPARAATGAGKRVAVIFPPALDPCAEAVEGFRLRLAGSEITVALLDVNKSGLTAEEFTRKPAAVVAVGSEAVEAMLAQTPAAVSISTMTLEADHPAAPRSTRPRAAVYLDIPVRAQVAELRKLFPEKTRIGVIRNPNRGAPTVAQIRGQGAEFASLQIADCATPDELLPAFLSLRKRVDFVICLPDGTLYNGATARPLIMASLENRLPLVGFSPAFVRAGAAVGVWPDYRAIGQQTADLVRHCLDATDCPVSENPKKINVAVNAKILRMLGIEFAAASNPDLVVLR